MGSDMYYQLGKDLNYASWSAKKMPGYQKLDKFIDIIKEND